MNNQEIITRLLAIEENASNVHNEAYRLRKQLEMGTPVAPKRATQVQIKAREDANKRLRRKHYNI